MRPEGEGALSAEDGGGVGDWVEGLQADGVFGAGEEAVEGVGEGGVKVCKGGNGVKVE